MFKYDPKGNQRNIYEFSVHSITCSIVQSIYGRIIGTVMNRELEKMERSGSGLIACNILALP
jgi:hypothetical protein